MSMTERISVLMDGELDEADAVRELPSRPLPKIPPALRLSGLEPLIVA